MIIQGLTEGIVCKGKQLNQKSSQEGDKKAHLRQQQLEVLNQLIKNQYLNGDFLDGNILIDFIENKQLKKRNREDNKAQSSLNKTQEVSSFYSLESQDKSIKSVEQEKQQRCLQEQKKQIDQILNLEQDEIFYFLVSEKQISLNEVTHIEYSKIQEQLLLNKFQQILESEQLQNQLIRLLGQKYGLIQILYSFIIGDKQGATVEEVLESLGKIKYKDPIDNDELIKAIQ